MFQPLSDSTGNEADTKIILLHGFSDAQIKEFLDHYHESGLPESIFASITPKSKLKRVRDLLKELAQESRHIK